jgi:hypothetical protein
MSERLSLLPEPKQAGSSGAEHMFTYRRRVADGCGGHHAQGPEFAGHPIWK